MRRTKLAILGLVGLFPAVAYGGITSVLEDRASSAGTRPDRAGAREHRRLDVPVASASSGVTYAYDPRSIPCVSLESPARSSASAPRPSAGRFNFSASFSYVHLTSINGEDLDSLVNRPRVNGQTLIFPVRGGITLANGRFATFLPVRVVADLDVEAYILSPSVTYGLTPDLDVNLTLPLLRTSLGVTAHTQAPDPRFPDFALNPGDIPAIDVRSLSDDAYGIGDVLLRAKYVLRRTRWVDVAAGLALSLPSGNEDDLQGTGTTRVQPRSSSPTSSPAGSNRC
jgi:hypothetical protein